MADISLPSNERYCRITLREPVTGGTYYANHVDLGDLTEKINEFLFKDYEIVKVEAVEVTVSVTDVTTNALGAVTCSNCGDPLNAPSGAGWRVCDHKAVKA